MPRRGDQEGLIPLANANGEVLTWFRRMGLGPNELAALAPYLYEDPQRALTLSAKTVPIFCCRHETQRILSKRAPVRP